MCKNWKVYMIVDVQKVDFVNDVKKSFESKWMLSIILIFYLVWYWIINDVTYAFQLKFKGILCYLTFNVGTSFRTE